MPTASQLSACPALRCAVTIRRVILTGPPGSGKSALLAGLAKTGYATVAESATDVIAEMQRAGQREPWTDPSFTERIAMLQRQRQLHADADASEIIVFDRSPVCTLALAQPDGFPQVGDS